MGINGWGAGLPRLSSVELGKERTTGSRAPLWILRKAASSGVAGMTAQRDSTRGCFSMVDSFLSASPVALLESEAARGRDDDAVGELVALWGKLGSVEATRAKPRDSLAKHKQGDTQPKGTGGEMSMKIAQSSDVSKFMSYIEVSRTQHNLVKNMKQSGDGIKTKHLTRVIGDLNKFHVKPYGTLIDGEQRRLRQHWLNILHNDLPAALEVHRDRKVVAENQRKLLSLELDEKNVSIVRKADQLAGITKELGQHDACEIAGSSDLQNDLVEHSSQDMLHDGNDHCPSRQYCNEDRTKHMETSVDPHDSLCVKNQDLMVDNGTYIMDQSEKSDLQDQDHKDTSYVDKGVFLCASNLDEQNADLMDMKFSNYGPDVQAEDIKEISHTDTTIIDHSPEIQEKTTCYITAPIHAIDIRNTRAQNLEVITYTGPSIHAHEQDQGLKRTSYNGHGVNDTPLANSYTEMNDVIMDLKESQSSTVIPSNSSTLLSKSSGEQIPMEEFHLNDQVAKGGKDVWELPGPHDSYYRPLENSMYNDYGGFQIRHRHLRGAQQGSVIGLKNDILSHQDSQVTIASAFPMDNPGSFMQQCSNRQSNGQLQIVGNNIGILPYSLEHIDRIGQPTALHSLVNNRLSQSTQFSSPFQEHQMTDQSNNVLYDQLHKDPYSDMRFSAKGNTHIDERRSSAAHGPIERNRYNCFPQEHQPHDNWPAMESNNCLPQALPGGITNSDGSLFSALAQYNQPPSLQMQSGRSSPGQLLEMSNQAPLSGIFFPRIQETAPRVPNIYGYVQNVPSSSSSRVASVGSVNNMQWTNLIQQNHPGMPNLMNRQFRGPWTR
ncbi:hypothetical protein GUJ93_ZPchr0007g5985 [Zizania palustris]|uniref:Uncharacterized protein n=1 Tax=Zizania palustris TaxID=103762 RepID=A0A8J5T6E7_ZIZPA|nr:hypothetical protein GUJ93_ZPchr0007g5985 [Zizania palustris]